MKNKFLFIIIGMILIISIINYTNSATNYCCEKTIEGAWCQNAEASKCDENYRSVPTSCESTSYCKLGCCYDTSEGTCMENTPQKICEDNEGVWEENAECEIPQCKLGCCLLGDQAAYVTQTRCKRLSALYGLDTSYRTDINSEMSCIASASSDIKGACVFEKDYEKTCKLLTKKECDQISAGNGTKVKFHEGYLCSADSLGTNCGPTQETTCVEDDDKVYFVDSCGNLANVYDASKIENKNYWTYIAEQSSDINICGQGNSNANSKTCGNCDYYLGSTCKQYQRSESVKPSYGNYICKDLSCEYNGENYQHGETWCANAPGTENNAPGSRYFRMVCYNGEVTIEPCADFRQEYCLESDINGFSTAACVVNKWQDNSWGSNSSTEKTDIAPGLEFWNTEGDALQICSQGSSTCAVTYTKGVFGEWECESNCECLSENWEDDMREECRKLGDCGEQENYLGYK